MKTVFGNVTVECEQEDEIVFRLLHTGLGGRTTRRAISFDCVPSPDQLAGRLKEMFGEINVNELEAYVFAGEILELVDHEATFEMPEHVLAG